MDFAGTFDSRVGEYLLSILQSPVYRTMISKGFGWVSNGRESVDGEK